MPRIPSLAQIQASRQNGARSPGPKSPEAKAKTRLNALQHGLTARTAVLPHESESRFRALLDQFIAEHQPGTLTELTLLENFATSAWRLRRFAAYETAIHAYEIEHTGPAPGADFHTHAALTWADSTRLRQAARYQATEQRLFRHSFHDLLAFQHLRGDQNEAAERQEVPENQSATVNAEVLRNDPEAEDATPQTQEAVTSQHHGDSPAVEPAGPETETHHCGDQNQAHPGEQAQPNQAPAANPEALRNDPEPQITPQMKEAASPMFVMIWTDADKAYNFCCDRDKVAFIPRQRQALEQQANQETPATEHPVQLTPRERFSQCMSVMFDALLKHPDAYRAVQLALRHWRNGPLAAT